MGVEYAVLPDNRDGALRSATTTDRLGNSEFGIRNSEFGI